MDPNIRQSIIDRLKQTNNVLVTVKNNPTVDQLAACIGLTLFLNKLGKHATAVFSGEVPSTIEFLKPEATLEKDTNSLRDFIIALDKSKADKLRYKVEDKVVKIFITPYRTSLSQDDLDFSQGDFNVDVVMALGVHAREELDQAIIAHGRILHDATVVSINAGKAADLGALNWNDDKASSLCEMVAGLIETMQANNIDAQMATAFLTGIVAETERFSNPKTTSNTMSISAKLMAAGANQQLVAAKLQEPAQVSSTDQKPAAKPEAGTLEIDHQKNEQPPAELPKVVDDDGSSILIDEDGNLKTGLQDEAQKEEKPAKPSRLTLEPPTLGSTLTANTKTDTGTEPSSDPMSTPQQDSTILEHKPASGLPNLKAPTLQPLTTKPDIKPNETLSAIEEQVDSPHVGTPAPAAPLASSNEPPKADSADPLLTDNTVSNQATTDIPPVAGIDDARKAVDAAAQASIDGTVQPIQALNAQPLGDSLNPMTPQPGIAGNPADIPLPPADTSMQTAAPQPSPLDLPPNLVPPDQGLPPEQTGTNQSPTPPPPVPPPMMPPTGL